MLSHLVQANGEIRISEKEFVAILEEKISDAATELTVIRLAIEMSVQANVATWDTLTKMIRAHSDKHADRERPRIEPRTNPDYGIMMQQHYDNSRAHSRSRERRDKDEDKLTGKGGNDRSQRECWEYRDKGTCRFGKECGFAHKPFLRGQGRPPARGAGLSTDRGAGRSQERESGRSSERGRRGGSPARSNSHGGTPYPSPGRSVGGRSPLGRPQGATVGSNSDRLAVAEAVPADDERVDTRRVRFEDRDGIKQIRYTKGTAQVKRVGEGDTPQIVDSGAEINTVPIALMQEL